MSNQTHQESHAGQSKVLRPWPRSTAILAVIIFAALLLNNAGPIFFAPHPEFDDIASNSLRVIQAKHFSALVGNYSRFGFYHPGPAFFYVYAAAEALLYDALHIVPTPLNAHLIALYALSAFFFSGSLGMVRRRLDPVAATWFVVLALLFAALHFGAVGRYYDFAGPYGLFNIWPPCVLVFPFLCFLVAAASVGSGSGKDLTLLALAGCCLVHGHVAMPLFVVPITLLAYGNLWLTLRRRGNSGPARPWQAFSRQHLIAVAIITLFVIPILVDVFSSTPSNLRLILDHVRGGYGEKKGLLQSILYFTHFAAYSPYPNGSVPPALENIDLPGTVGFLKIHWRAYSLWLTAIVTPLVLLRIVPGLLSRRPETSGTSSSPADLRRFFVHLYCVLGGAILLTVVWGCIQEGPMYYYNALFNFAILYAFLLVLAIVVAQSISRLRILSPRLMTAGLSMVTLAAVAAFAQEARHFRYRAQDSEGQRLFESTMRRALEVNSAQPKLLSFEGQAWAEAVGVALYLERAGIQWRVAAYAPLMPIIFGRNNAVPDKEATARLPDASRWQIVSTASSATLIGREAGLVALPVAPNVELVIPTSLSRSRR